MPGRDPHCSPGLVKSRDPKVENDLMCHWLQSRKGNGAVTSDAVGRWLGEHRYAAIFPFGVRLAGANSRHADREP
jgi:hypothetical protein